MFVYVQRHEWLWYEQQQFTPVFMVLSRSFITAQSWDSLTSLHYIRVSNNGVNGARNVLNIAPPRGPVGETQHAHNVENKKKTKKEV